MINGIFLLLKTYLVFLILWKWNCLYSGCDTDDDSYIETLVKNEAGLDNKTLLLENKTEVLDIDNTAQALDSTAQELDNTDQELYNTDIKAPIIRLVNSKFTVATQVRFV